MNKTEMLRHVMRWEPCGEGANWCRTFDGDSAEAAWRSCPDPTWLLWAAAHAGVDKRLLLRVAYNVCLFVVPHMEADLSREECKIYLDVFHAVNNLDGSAEALQRVGEALQRVDEALRRGDGKADAARDHNAARAIVRLGGLVQNEWRGTVALGLNTVVTWCAEGVGRAATSHVASLAAVEAFNSDVLQLIHDNIPWAVVEEAIKGQGEEGQGEEGRRQG